MLCLYFKDKIELQVATSLQLFTFESEILRVAKEITEKTSIYMLNIKDTDEKLLKARLLVFHLSLDTQQLTERYYSSGIMYREQVPMEK